MKKLHLDPRFWLTAAFCTALLAVPPVTARARAQQYADTALPRPEVTGVMTDAQRLDPTVSALYKQQVLANSGYTIGEENSHKYTMMLGKLRQAHRRGLLSAEQLDYLVELVQATEEAEAADLAEHQASGLNYCTLHTDAAGIEHLELAACTAPWQNIASPDTAVNIDAYIDISYLPNNGPILGLHLNTDALPADTDTAALLDSFTRQLDLTIPGEWEPGGDTTRFHRAAGLTAAYTTTIGSRNLAVYLGVLE